MDTKHNEATHNRPWGDRPVDAPMVPIDLHAYTQEIMQEEAWQKNDRNAITVFKTDHITIVLGGLHKDAVATPGNNETDGILTVQVLEGSISFTAKQETLEINRGQMIVLHENNPWTITALEESVYLLTLTK